MSVRARITQCLTLLVAGVIISLPLLGAVVHLPRTTLSGVSMSYSWPEWSLKAVRKGAFQKRVETWALRSHALWGWSIKTMNEVVYRLTGEVSIDYGTSIQGGNEGFLWQPMYLRAFNRLKKPPEKIIKGTFDDFESVRKFFAQRGVPVVAVINPNILFLYPELLPEKYRAVRANKSSYEVARSHTAKRKIPWIDTFELLNGLKSSFSTRFFSPTGSHWNDLGSCLAVREVGRALARGWGEEIPDPVCEKFSMEFPPREPELDLVKIANLLNEQRLYQPAPYTTEIPRATLKKPRKILMVGTSFLFGLEHQLLKRGIADSTTILFYFRQIRRNGDGDFAGFNTSRLTPEALAQYDAIIVDVNAAGPGVLGYGFLQHVMKQFGISGK